MNLIQHKATGLYVRKETDDSRAFSEVKDYDLLPVDGMVVLDIGAHVGFSIDLFLKRNAKKIYAYEADPETFEVLQKNFGGNPKCVLQNAAVTGDSQEKITFYRKKNTRDGTLFPPKISSVIAKPITVDAVNFQDILKSKEPNVLKIDCEGAEHSFSFALPGSIEAIAMELHTRRKEWMESSKKIVGRIEDQGFTPIVSPNWNSMYSTVGVWLR